MYSKVILVKNVVVFPDSAYSYLLIHNLYLKHLRTIKTKILFREDLCLHSYMIYLRKFLLMKEKLKVVDTCVCYANANDKS